MSDREREMERERERDIMEYERIRVELLQFVRVWEREKKYERNETMR